MTTSADTKYDGSALQIISDALANVGAIGPGKTATGAKFDHGLRLLNDVVKAIDADGSFLWRTSRRTFTTTDGFAEYTIAQTDVLNIDEPINYRRAGQNTRTPIRLISLDDFQLIPDRTIQGVPTMMLVEKTLPTTVTVTLFPTPDATGDTITYQAMLRAQDYDTGAQTGDFPSRWVLCLKYGLSAELALAYGGQVALARSLRSMFLEEKERQLNASGEKGGFRMVPWGGSYY